MNPITISKAVNEIIISYGHNVRQPQLKQDNLENIISTIKSDQKLKQIIQQVRTAGDKEERGKIKKHFHTSILAYLKTTIVKIKPDFNTIYSSGFDKLKSVDEVMVKIKKDKMHLWLLFHRAGMD